MARTPSRSSGRRRPSGPGITLLNAAGSPALISGDPKFILLADNGCGAKSGAPDNAVCMPTHAITGCSLAHDVGTNPLSFHYDERGSGYPRVAGIAADIGAYELEPNGDIVKLTITHSSAKPNSKVIVAVSGGWPKILSNLKSFLETGKPIATEIL